MRTLAALIILFISFVPSTWAQTNRTAKSVKQQKTAVQKEIKETSKKLSANKTETSRSLAELDRINADIAEHESNMKALENQVIQINSQLNKMNDSIALNEQRLSYLRENYAKAIKGMHLHASTTNKLSFIFSASSFREGYRRMRYLQEFSRWRYKQVAEIQNVQNALTANRNTINVLAQQKTKNMQQQGMAKLTLQQKQKEQNEVVTKLRKEGKELQSLLADQQKKARDLDRELDRIIAEQERIAAEKRRKQEEERRRAQQAAQERRKQEAKAKTQAQAQAKAGSKSKATASTTTKSDVAATAPSKSTSSSAATTPAPSMENKLTGSFESNKGRLPYPLQGRIVRHFGINQHPNLPHVKIESGGIDIQTSVGAVAKAVFDGTVSAVFQQDGYNKVVMVRHGSYLTIYVNLGQLYVSSGSAVKAGQQIGKVCGSANDSSVGMLHFEIRRETQKLNPEQWLRR